MKKNRKSLKTLYHMDPSKAKAEYAVRYASENAIHFPLMIGDNPSFAVYTKEIGDLLTDILRKDRRIAEMENQIPNSSLLLENSILDEIEMNNQIEEVYSSRKALQQVWSVSSSFTGKFRGMVHQYRLLINPTHNFFLKTAEDFRKAYDLLLLEDMEKESPEDIPDGVLFRKGKVGIYSGGKEIHAGLYPENEIITAINAGLDYVENGEADPLIKVAFLHYLIGYVHPFYDGNGRINRYVCTVLLENHLSLYGILQLSYMIRTHRTDYYKVFEDAEHPLNKGEITEFIVYFLEMLSMSLDKSLEILEDKYAKYLELQVFINKFPSKTERDILEILADFSLFSWHGATKQEIANLTGWKEITISKFIKKYQNLIFAEKDGRWKRFSLNMKVIPANEEH